jgi:hypothetical protein
MASNRDFGGGKLLRRTDLSPYWAALLDCARTVLGPEDYSAYAGRLDGAA